MRPGGYVGYAGRLAYPRRGTALNRGECRKASKPSGSLRNRDIANAEVQRFLASSRRLLLTKPFSITDLYEMVETQLDTETAQGVKGQQVSTEQTTLTIFGRALWST